MLHLLIEAQAIGRTDTVDSCPVQWICTIEYLAEVSNNLPEIGPGQGINRHGKTYREGCYNLNRSAGH
jgi:hypothetical protein